jgi:hypothetical protein
MMIPGGIMGTMRPNAGQVVVGRNPSLKIKAMSQETHAIISGNSAPIQITNKSFSDI